MQSYKHANLTPISFGWYYKMHTDILKKSAGYNDIPATIKNILIDSVRKPDLEEFFLFGQKHFYYPNDKVKSFLDYTGTHNAKHLYKTHVKKALKAIKSGNKSDFADEAGRALHYLQDVTQPHHIDSGSIIAKAKEAIVPHHKFEMDAYYMQNEFYDKFTPIEIIANSFSDLFDKTVNLSQKNQIPRKNNIENWDSIIKNSLDLALSSTGKFLEMIMSMT